ncbi:MAG TPA: hypothetical protein VGN29_20315 [Solirubrobacteraceae bacterium]|nr:hypothetical protein [Solirubrobacteraceae bacterium]
MTTEAVGARARAESERPARVARSWSWWATLWPLGLYAVLSLALFGVHIIRHLDSRIVASDPIDSSQFMWFFAWWPHALLHGLNPFVTHVMFVPDGFNLTWSTAMPGPSLLLAPITLAFGPAVTWNIIQLASPALSAWTAFLLCRHVTSRTAPSLVGGYIFGFSPYMLTHLTGGPYLALVPLLPLFVLLVLRRLEGSIGSRAFLAWTAVAMIAQFSISSEVLATATLFGAIALALAFALLPERRTALVDVVKLLIGALAVTVVVVSPYLLYFEFGHHYPPGATFFSADLTSFVIPPSLVALSHHHGAPAIGSSTESYLGVPLLLLIGWFIWQGRRSRVTWVIAGSLLIAVIFALGATLFVHGHKTGIHGPWWLLKHLPVLRYAIPVRFAVFYVLPAALMVALLLSRWSLRQPAGVAAWALAAVAVAFIVPNVGSSSFDTRIADPPFFASGAYKAYLHPSDNVLTIPAWGPNERWQANTGFRFNLSDGYAGNPFPPSFTRYPAWNMFLTGRLTPDYVAQLRRYVHDKRVTAVVVDRSVPGPWTKLFGSLGVRPVSTGGVLVYRLRPAP